MSNFGSSEKSFISQINEAKKMSKTSNANGVSSVRSVGPSKGASSDGSGSLSSMLHGDASFDAFELCDLSFDYSKGSPYFTPIYIEPASVLSEGSEDSLAGLKIKLPLNPQKITDSVSVSFSRRIDNIAGSNVLIGFMNKTDEFLKGFNSTKNKTFLSADLQNMLMFNYDARSLRKEIQVPYIIPISHNVKVNEIRKGLNVLQGLVYPRFGGLTYPPYVSITIGGIYVRLKGFISQVSVEFDETITNISGTQFPLIITGTIHFVCMQPFTWSSLNIAGVEMTNEQFVLMDKTLLFGADLENEAKYYPPINTRAVSNYSPFKQKLIKNYKLTDFQLSNENLNNISNSVKLNKIISLYDIQPITDYFTKQNDLISNLDTSFMNEEIFRNTNFNTLIDQSSVDTIKKFVDVQDKINYELTQIGALNSLGINLNTSSFKKSLDNLTNSFSSISNPAIFSNVMNTMQNKNIIGNINNLTNAVNTTILTDITKSTNNIFNSLKNNINIISNIDDLDRLDVSNIFEYALNYDGFTKQLEAISLDSYNLDKNYIINAIYSNSLSDIIRITNTLRLIESLLKNILIIYEDSNKNIAIETMCKIQTITNTLLIGNIISILTEMQKTTTTTFNEFCNIEYTNNNINYSIKEQAELAYNELSVLMPYNMNRSVSATHTALTNLLSRIIF
jgi:hypothetical protein